jgi:glycosyltransferase involved in cell wall biosynthesis
LRRLRIGVNALYLIPGGVGGTEIYLRNLLRALGEIDSANDYILFTNRETQKELGPDLPNFHIATQPVRAVFRPARMGWEQTGLPLAVAGHRTDVLLNPGFTAPILCGCPQVTVFHDLQHKRHPEHFRWFDLPFWKFFLFWSVHLSRLVIADSDTTGADIQRFYRFPGSKIRVVPLGVEPGFFTITRGRRAEPLLLSVSTLHPHKNLDRLIRAFATFRIRHPDFRLVIAGLRGFETGNLESLRDRLGLTAAVQFTGWIPREELYDLYAGACAFLYPSTFEGFGLPVLEALAAGIPTACSRIEPLASTVAEAALVFDPQDEGAMIGAMERLVSDGQLRERLAASGPERASRYSWHTTARLTLEALREAAA